MPKCGTRGILLLPSPLDYARYVMKDSDNRLNIRYMGFESTSDGGRRLDFSVTAPGRMTTRIRFAIPSQAFSGANRITFQESAAMCYEKLRDVIEHEQPLSDAACLQITEKDIEQFRPRGRRAGARK